MTKNKSKSQIKTSEILVEVYNEREKQNQKWGEQNHRPIEWIAILSEEVGEASKHALEGHFLHPIPNMFGKDMTKKDSDLDIEEYHYKKYREELIQVAAVAVQMVESLDRNEFLG